jgi:hypothetical protein
LIKAVKQAGFQLLDIIRTKTQKGIDFNDIPFAPYSQGYLKKFKQNRLNPTNVDLHYSGRYDGFINSKFFY